MHNINILMNYLKYKFELYSNTKFKNLNFVVDGRNHYVYRITNMLSDKHYYGSRVTKLEPNEDLGIKYFSSSSNKEFLKEQKDCPEHFKYKIIRIFDNPRDCIIYESYIHEKFKVGYNLNFYNKVNQTPFGWNTTGNSITALKGAKTMAIIDDDTGLSIRQKASDKAKITNSTINPITGNSKAKDTAIKGSITKSIKDSITGLSTNDIVGVKKRGKNHHKFSGLYVYGSKKFESTYEMSRYFSNIPATTLTKWFKDLDIRVSNISYTMSKFLQDIGTRSDIVNKSFRELGFDFEFIHLNLCQHHQD